MKYLILFISLIINITGLFAQNGTLIGNKPGAIENCAELEVYSTNRGFLIPVMANTSSITNPVAGLLIYNSTLKVYNYYDGSIWIPLPLGNTQTTIRDNDGNTQIRVDKGTDEDKTFMDIAGTETLIIDSDFNLTVNNGKLLINGNTALAMPSTSIASGQNSGASVSGTNNTFVGASAGQNTSSGNTNTFVGYNAGNDITTQSDNTIIGSNAGSISTASQNTILGASAATSLTSGANNVIVGTESGATVSTNGNNIFIGYQAGNTTTGSDNILIGNAVEASPLTANNYLNIGDLIEGDLSAGNVIFKGTTDDYIFPAATGTLAQTMVLDTDGYTIIWADVPETVVEGLDGSSADLFPYDIGNSSSGQFDTQGYENVVEITTYRDAVISKMSTRVRGNGTGNIWMGIYGPDFELIGKGTVACPTAGFATVDLTVAGGKELKVLAGQNYYLAIHFIDSSSPQLYKSSAVTYNVFTGWNPTTPTTLDDDISGQTLNSGQAGFWVRVY